MQNAKTKHFSMMFKSQALLSHLSKNASDCKTPESLVKLLTPLLEGIYEYAPKKEASDFKILKALSSLNFDARVLVKKQEKLIKGKGIQQYLTLCKSYKKEGLSNQKIADKLLKDFDYKASRETIRKALS